MTEAKKPSMPAHPEMAERPSATPSVGQRKSQWSMIPGTGSLTILPQPSAATDPMTIPAIVWQTARSLMRRPRGDGTTTTWSAPATAFVRLNSRHCRIEATKVEPTGMDSRRLGRNRACYAADHAERSPWSDSGGMPRRRGGVHERRARPVAGVAVEETEHGFESACGVSECHRSECTSGADRQAPPPTATVHRCPDSGHGRFRQE